MAYYDKIASQWHKITGYSGGAFKKHQLNDCIIDKLESIENRSILEIGAGNGYFMPLVLRRFSGQRPSKIHITDISVKMLSLAKSHFQIDGAEYLQLDVRSELPFKSESIDIILATMVFNELSKAGLHKAITQCTRVLKPGGKFIITVLHPGLLKKIAELERLKSTRGMLTMPGSSGIRVPAVLRSPQEYEKMIKGFMLDYVCEDIYANKKVLNQKPGLAKMGKIPIAKIFDCKKISKKDD